MFTVRLVTACGCERLMNVRRRHGSIRVPYPGPNRVCYRPQVEGEFIEMKYREFEYVHRDGSILVYKEVVHA